LGQHVIKVVNYLNYEGWLGHVMYEAWSMRQAYKPQRKTNRLKIWDGWEDNM